MQFLLTNFIPLRLISILFLYVVSVTTNHVLCQENQDSVEVNLINFVDFHIELALPVNTYGSRVTGNAVGFSGIVLRQSNPNNPRFYGIGANYHFFDSYEVQDIILIEGADVEVRDKTSTHELGLFLIGRQFSPINLSKFEIFVDLKIGVRWLYAVQSLHDLDFDENINYDLSSSGFAFNLGLGGGVQYPITDDFSISTRVIYNAGSKTDYLASLDNEPEELSEDGFQEYNTTTDLISFSLGLSWIF